VWSNQRDGLTSRIISFLTVRFADGFFIGGDTMTKTIQFEVKVKPETIVSWLKEWLDEKKKSKWNIVEPGDSDDKRILSYVLIEPVNYPIFDWRFPEDITEFNFEGTKVFADREPRITESNRVGKVIELKLKPVEEHSLVIARVNNSIFEGKFTDLVEAIQQAFGLI
jgi:hypothetical protein